MLSLTFIISLIDFIRKIKHANYDKRYNYIFIFSNIIIMLIILRGFFDKDIVTNVINDGYGSKMLFVANNLIYFNIMYACLIIYRFTIKKNKGLQ